MRLLSRHAPVEEMITTSDDGQYSGRMEVPLKAQKVLGEKPRFNYNLEAVVVGSGDGAQNEDIVIPPKAQKLLGEKGQVSNIKRHHMKYSGPDSLWGIRDVEQKSLGAHLRSEADSDTLPGAKRGAPLPVGQIPIESTEDLMRSSSNDSTGRTGTSTYPGHQPSLESMSREYYDASRHPLYISQQTSESSVRDKALYKGSTPISDTSSDAPLLALPPYNAIKPRRPGNDRAASDEPKRHRKLDLISLFPHPKTSNGILSSVKFSRPPVASPASSEFFPRETVHAKVARNGSRLRLEMEQSSKPLPKQPVNNNGERVKIFESDIYDSNKTHVHRPPKGTQNWFDALDISSDEDEPEAVAIPPVELPANEIPRVQEALPSVFSPYSTQMRESPTPYQASPEPQTETSVIRNQSPREATRHQMQANSDQSSVATERATPRASAVPKRVIESRLAHSRLGVQSVLSLDSESGGEDTWLPAPYKSFEPDNVILEEASSLELQRPLEPIRKLDGQESGSRAVHPGTSAVRTKSARSKTSATPSPPSVRSRSNGSLLSDSSPVAPRRLRALHESPGQPFPIRPRTNESNERDGAESAGGDTMSSVPTNGSRMMAVTEEEMLLLERMRQKRAAMQKDSFTEGYRLALQEERLQQTSDNGFVHDQALLSLGKSPAPTTKDRETSTTESLLREALDHRRRMSAIRREDVDRAFKMGRFLAMEAPHGDRPPKIDRFLVMAPGLAGEFEGRPISGTEIEIESRYDSIEEKDEESASNFDEKEETGRNSELPDEPRVGYDNNDGQDSYSESETKDDERDDMKTPKQSHGFSPMQRLTDQVRDLPARDQQLSDEQRNDGPRKAHPFLRLKLDAERTKPGALPTPPTDDIREQSILYDSEGRELLSPKVYTPLVGGTPSSPKPRELDLLLPDPKHFSGDSTLEYKVDSPDTPVATTWARPSSLKHPQPQRQPLGLDFTPLEIHPVRTAPPSIATAGISPLTPTFEPASLSPLEATSERAGADNVSVLSGSHASNPEVPHPLKSHPVSPRYGRKYGKASSPRSVENIRPKPGRITSMASITSAGEDVLAAWAELGGGRTDALAFRRKPRLEVQGAL